MTKTGESDETLAEKAGVSRVQISRIRRDLSRPSPELADRLSKITGIPAWDFVKPLKAPRSQSAA
jgi:transcriptional regulator with XRE-family HTH domain